MESLTIAQKILNQATDVRDVHRLAEEMHIDIDQNWENEETTYMFDDNSAILISGFEYRAITY